MTKSGKGAYDDEKRPAKKSSGGKPAAKKPSENKSTGKKPVKKELSRKERAKKTRKRILLFTTEIVVLAVMVIVLWGVLKGEKAGHVVIPEEDIIINQSVKVEQKATMRGYRNIALFGLDSTKGELTRGTRSDSIMIASINQDTGECRLVSVYRDTYLNLSNDSYNKCNTAYAKGGPEMAINMLNMNLDMNITDFVAVGFAGLADTIDALGGVYIDVDSNEVLHANNYQSCLSEDMKRDYIPIEGPGYQLLTGLQAAGYCRVRYGGGDDFRRTERQREVLGAMSEQAKKASVASLTSIANNVFSEIYTSLSLDEIVSLLGDVTKYKIVDTAGFPTEELRGGVHDMGGKGDCVVPLNLEENVKWLHEYLFDDKEYEPSDTVKSCSEKIEQDYNKYK